MVVLGTVVAVALVLLGYAMGVLPLRAFSPRSQRPSSSVVMISGRDDHGLLQEPTIALYDAPDGKTVVGHAGDGSFASVVDQRGEWIRVQLLGNPSIGGWVNDFYLRGRLIRTDGGGQVDLVTSREIQGQLWLGVRPVDKPQATPIWLNPAGLKEIGAQNDK